MDIFLKTIKKTNKILIPIIFSAFMLFIFIWFWPVILPFFLSAIFAYLLHPVINFFEYKGFSRTTAIILTYIIIASLITIFFMFLVPVLTSEFETLRKQLPNYINFIQNKFFIIEEKIKNTHQYFNNIDISGKFITSSEIFIKGFVDRIPSFVGNLFSFIYIGILIPFITFFILKDGWIFRKNIIKLIPNKYFEIVLGLYFRLEQQIGNYIRGKVLQTVIISIIVSIGAIIIDIPYAIFMGIFAGIINLIPYIGPVIGSIPALIVVAITKQNFFALISTGTLFAFAQLVDNIILQPLIVARSIDMHPLFVIISLTLGGYLAGIWGMLLGIPVIGMLKVIITEIYKEINIHLYNQKMNHLDKFNV